MAFTKAYRREPPDVAVIAGVYGFADWCLAAPRGRDAGTDPFTSVVVCFYEDLPTDRRAREDMPRWMPFADVADNRPTFSYHLGDDGYRELVEFMSKRRHLYVPRDRPIDR